MWEPFCSLFMYKICVLPNNAGGAAAAAALVARAFYQVHQVHWRLAQIRDSYRVAWLPWLLRRVSDAEA